MTSRTLRRWISWSMVAVLVISLGGWWWGTRDQLPKTIRVATAEPGGQYHGFGRELREIIHRVTENEVEVELVPTNGSVENLQRLLAGDVDLAIVQGGSVDLTPDSLEEEMEPRVIAPLFHEILHIAARRDRGIENLTDLANRRVIVGKEGSGMLESASALLSHYELLDKIQQADSRYFNSLPDAPEIDAAIITTGILNDDMVQILSSGEYSLLRIRDAAAIEMRNRYYSTFTIPRGLYREQPPVPEEEIETLATTAFLVGRRNTAGAVNDLLLQAVYEEGMVLDIPTLLPRSEGGSWLDMPLHPDARRYFDPKDEIGHLAAVMESAAATKELLFALIAAAYLVWERWHRLKEREEKAELQQQKSHLNQLLSRTLEIEARQTGVTEEEPLRRMLEEITRVKIKALEELTHEELRGDRSFLIFLTQSSDLISKLRAKLADSRADLPAARRPGPWAALGRLLEAIARAMRPNPR